MPDSRATLQKRLKRRDQKIEDLDAQVEELKDQVKVAREYASGLETENGDLRLDIRERRKINRKLQVDMGRLERELFTVLHRWTQWVGKRSWRGGNEKYVLSRLVDLAAGGAEFTALRRVKGQEIMTSLRALETVRLLTE